MSFFHKHSEMNYVKLSREVEISNINDISELLFDSRFSRSERIELIRKLRWAYRYMRNSMFRIMKDAASKELLNLIFDRELIPSDVLAARDEYEFKRLTRFEFVYKFVEWFKANPNLNGWECNKKDICMSRMYFSFIVYLFHMVNHLCIRGSEAYSEFEFGVIRVECFDSTDDRTEDEFSEEVFEEHEMINDVADRLYKLNKTYESNVVFSNRDQYVDEKLKECIQIIDLPPNFIETLEKCLLQQGKDDEIETLKKFNKEKQHELILDFYSTSSMPNTEKWCCESCFTEYFDEDEYHDYQCICLEDPNMKMIHSNSLFMAEELYRMIKLDGMCDTTDMYTYYNEIFDEFYINFPFFYGDEHLFKLCDNDEAKIKHFLYENMYERIMQLLK